MLHVEKNNGVRRQNGSNPTGENNRHVITGVKFVHELGPFQVWTNLVLFKVRNPHEVFLFERNERAQPQFEARGGKVHAL